MVRSNLLIGFIFLLSGIIFLLFALVILGLRRSARILQEKTWATPFATAFVVLAAMYFLRFCNFLIEEHLYGDIATLLPRIIKIIIFTSSGVTNYLFLLSAFRLLDPALNESRLLSLKKRLIGSAFARRVSSMILCLAALMQIGTGSEFVGTLASGWFSVPDGVFSALAFCVLGFVLYQSISLRRDKTIAWLALVSSVCYGALYLFYGLGWIHSLVRSVSSTEIQNSLALADLLTFLMFLLLSFGLFFPGYELMLLISAPVEGMERLLRNVTRNQKEYLESSGIVRSICTELQLRSVHLYIRLPGSNENQIALYRYPSLTSVDDQEPRKFVYEENRPYARVMSSGQPYNAYQVNSFQRSTARIATVAVPVFFHGSVIACLEGEIAKIGSQRATAVI